MLDRSLELIAAAVGGHLSGGDGTTKVRGVSTDTRSVAEGNLFVALEGENFDGHDFVVAAFQKGAAAALVSRQVGKAGPQIVVPDTLAALGDLARIHRSELDIKVVAITGSTGKTTTKEMAAAILSQGWRTARTPGNFNNEIGVPLALLGLEREHQAMVVELAMRGRGQIAYLAGMARPQVGMITNIGLSHIELLGSREAIAEAKAELLAALPEEGVAVLNADDDLYHFLRERTAVRVVSFGTAAEADVRVLGVEMDAGGRARVRLRGWWGEEEVRLKAAGRHQALNAAAAAAAAMSAGGEAEWVAPGLASFEATDMRSEIAQAPGGYTVINDCYNAAPTSMRVALELLADLPGKRKFAVLGDMKELGAMSAEWHREVGEIAGALGVNGLVTVGSLGRLIGEGARSSGVEDVEEAADNSAAAEAVRRRLAAGDVVLVKGSRAMKMEEIVVALTAAPRKEAQG